jgi:hypothetical protein
MSYEGAEPTASPPIRHRASYIFERGIWRATCRCCGWQTSDPDRRRANSLFRMHIQDRRDAFSGIPLLGPVIDLGPEERRQVRVAASR